MFKKINAFFVVSACVLLKISAYADPATGNQTDTVSPVYSNASLPFTLDVQTASIQIPGGIQTYALAVYNEKCLLISGRTNGLHGFNPGTNNFPPVSQNTTVFVVDFKKQQVFSRSLSDASSGLNQLEIDSLSTTAPQNRQVNNTLYLVGGYGVNTATGLFETKSTLSAIDVPGLMHWVQNPKKGETAKQYIRQIVHPIFQVTGGDLYQINPHDPFLLIFGQNFAGYYTSSSTGFYTNQVRTFKLVDDGVHLAVTSETYKEQNSNYQRRDLNVVPIIQKQGNNYVSSVMALSGVFTPGIGIWTVPVFIDHNGDSFMPDPSLDNTFKQGMNNYNSARLGLYSKKRNEMHTVILGGLSYETYSGGVPSFDEEVPFTNNITDVVIDSNGNMAQYLIDAEYPTIPSNFTHIGVPLLFGTGARFIPAKNLPLFPNNVMSLDSLKQRTLLGYIIGGIMSTVTNTIDPATETAASPYIFEVYATPQ